jgi:hypothetical protein
MLSLDLALHLRYTSIPETINPDEGDDEMNMLL